MHSQVSTLRTPINSHHHTRNIHHPGGVKRDWVSDIRSPYLRRQWRAARRRHHTHRSHHSRNHRNTIHNNVARPWKFLVVLIPLRVRIKDRSLAVLECHVCHHEGYRYRQYECSIILYAAGNSCRQTVPNYCTEKVEAAAVSKDSSIRHLRSQDDDE